MSTKILIVEDNPQNMKLVMMALRRHGYSFLRARDGEQALEIALREKPELIIMDIKLPKMDGLEVIKRLHQNPDFSETPIIAVTAYAMKGDREKFLEAGFDAYLPKPVDTRELTGLVAQMCRGDTKPYLARLSEK